MDWDAADSLSLVPLVDVGALAGQLVDVVVGGLGLAVAVLDAQVSDEALRAGRDVQFDVGSGVLEVWVEAGQGILEGAGYARAPEETLVKVCLIAGLDFEVLLDGLGKNKITLRA